MNNAIELAVQEGIRTKSLHWFDTLINYVNQGFTKQIKPEYFYESLKALYAIDQVQFKELVIALGTAIKMKITSTLDSNNQSFILTY